MTEFATTHPEQFGLAQVHWPSFREALCGCVVDLGAGEGSTLDLKSRVAPSIFRPRLLVEVDVVQEAREGTAHRVCGDLDSGRLPLASRSFDAVICNHVLEHLEQPDLLLGEIARVVRPGGLLVTAVPNGAAMSDVLFRAWYGATHRGESRFRGHVQRFTRASFLDMLRVGGFDTLSVSDMGEAYSWLRKHPWLQKPLRALTTRLRRLDNDRFILRLARDRAPARVKAAKVAAGPGNIPAPMQDKVGRDRQRIIEARARGRGATLRTYAALSGPGWLQSAITLGGGSLAGSLYLGVLTGFSLLWLQPLAMLMGVIMLSAIAYVTLSTGERPFRAINEHVNPVLGWGWAIATLLANVVWCLPQFALGTAAVQQNLIPALDGDGGKVVICGAILLVAVVVIWLYDSGSRGIRIFEGILKLMVGVVVVSFVGVVVVMGVGGGLDWSAIAAGYVPDLSLLWQPAATFDPHVAAVAPEHQSFWVDKIVADQRNVMVTAAATAVGINMTFLLPYSMLARGWDAEFRGLASFDLVTGLLLPFVLATSCIVVASATQFHAAADEALLAGDGSAPVALAVQFDALLAERAQVGGDVASPDLLPPAEQRLASMLVRRDAFNLADSLAPLTGRGVAQYVFGIGVLGMALSTVIILMLISGFAVCEMLGIEPRGRARRWGCMVAGIGVIGPFVWTGETKFWLAVPTSVFGMMLLPIAYLTFFCLMNSRSLLGDHLPRGGKRVAINGLMLLAVGTATFGASWSIWSAAGWIGVSAAAGFLFLALLVDVRRRRQQRGAV